MLMVAAAATRSWAKAKAWWWWSGARPKPEGRENKLWEHNTLMLPCKRGTEPRTNSRAEAALTHRWRWWCGIQTLNPKPTLTGGDDGAALKAGDEVGAVGLKQLVHTNVEAKFK